MARRSDLPLADDVTSRFLPWLVAPMVFLSALALAGAFTLSALVGRWDRDVSGTVTVEIAAAPGEPGESADKTRAGIEKAMRLLKETPGVVDARPLTHAELVALLSPWLGSGDVLKELPLPALIDVTVGADPQPDLAALSDRLNKEVPGATLDDHRVWLGRLVTLGRGIEGLTVAIVVLIAAATAATVIYATRSGMAVHREVIEVMHLIGAPDDYVARQFAARAFALGLRGGIFGLLAAAPAVLAGAVLAGRFQGGFLADLTIPVQGWVGLLALPPATAVLTMATARLTVHGALRRMM